MWECTDCSSGYLDPRPNQETIHLAYLNYYTHTGPNLDPEPKRTGWRALRNALANGYQNQQYGAAYENGVRIGAWLLRPFPDVRMALDARYRWLPHPTETQTARLLDVGCGSGRFLARAKKAGWRTFGCDPDPSARAAATGCGAEVRNGSAEVWLDQAGTFDAVTLSHVLEHVPEPVSTLKILCTLLRPGGFLYLDLPNISSLGHEFFGSYWRGLEVPRHLSLPNRMQLHRTLLEVGFTDPVFRNRHDIFYEMATRSALMAAGHSPYDHAKLVDIRTLSPGELGGSRHDTKRSEFLTVTARRGRARVRGEP